MISQINGAMHHTTEKLYWGQFGFKVVLQSKKKTRTKSWWGSGWNHAFISSKDATMLIEPHCPAKGEYKMQRNGYDVSVYFKTLKDADHFIAKVDLNRFKITEVVSPESDKHLALLSQDHKIVTRTSFFYKKFEWRVVFKRLDYTQVHDLREWVDGYFDQEQLGERFSFTDGVNCVLYLTTEDDVVVTKLAHASYVKKVEKVVLLNNDNNKVGTDETRTLSQTG